ncbi:MAG: hypothetical protein OXK72_03515 [Gammaproteobacteria bacterium]|nr:hypothetical protein [Gammaproteobacteria bacterium]
MASPPAYSHRGCSRSPQVLSAGFKGQANPYRRHVRTPDGQAGWRPGAGTLAGAKRSRPRHWQAKRGSDEGGHARNGALSRRDFIVTGA